MNAMESGSSNANADLLKAEGNALHQAQKYKAAYAKYSEAIKQDPKNAVLWANRAASALAMKSDPQIFYLQATKLDPKYTKAWGRQRTAYFVSLRAPRARMLGNFIRLQSLVSGCLPTNDKLSKTDQVLKAQFEDGMKKAQTNMDRKFIPDHVSLPNDSNVPWKRAMAMEPALVAQQQYTSSEFQQAIDGINEQHTKLINGREAMIGRTGTMGPITCGAVTLEAEQANAWAKGGPKLVQEEAPKRLKAGVLGWIMRGFFTSTFKTQGASAEFVFDALQVLEWGARVWRNVPAEDRGVIFEDTFIRGVKRLYLDFLVESYNKRNGDLETIAKVAREMIDEDMGPAQGAVDPGFASSFWVYPKADANVNLAWYYWQKAQATTDYDEGTELYKESAAHYYKGAILFPQDDGKHASFLRVCLEAHWLAESPLKVTLPIAKKIRESIPEMKKIWEYSATKMARDTWIEKVLSFENYFISEIEAGRVSLEESGGPEGHMNRHRV
ncbi:hypothetical protein DXG01_002140 [Tephrocybe rancida]|nr:hypothetical protein DXG01_002140 [Tephrocybe rancida]